MTLVNHAITGAIIATLIDKPIIALPLAFLSHFALDALPHFGYSDSTGFGEALKHKLTFFVKIIIDPILLLVFFGMLIYYAPSVWVYLAALLAILPDLEWPIAYFGFERRGKQSWRSPIGNFHWKIQRYERPWGLLVEFGWLAGSLVLLIRLLK